MKVHLLIYIFLSFSLIACSSNNALENKPFWDPSKYSVQNGDTLYSIAWRYDLDFRELASWNNISAPFLITPGQRLKMKGPVIEPADKEYLFGGKKENTVPDIPTNTVAIDYSQPKNIPTPPPIGGTSSKPIKPSRSVPIYNHRKSNIPPVIKATQKTSFPKPLPEGPVKWGWPIKGKVISNFVANNHDRKGIDIKGEQDQQIRSASDGIVVYSGSGLISYGKLVIIKHSDHFLSAYAYNKKLLVKEGASVSKGESIAIIGKRLNVTNLLHFEIRKDGKPVNPLVYLP